MQNHATQIARLAVRIIQLPHDDRSLANSLILKWRTTHRLSQMEQVQLDRCLAQAELKKN